MATDDSRFSSRELESGEDLESSALLSQRRFCFCIPCLRRPPEGSSAAGSMWWQRMRASARSDEERWWSRGVRAFMKLREWSEIVAGPKWKTFIRRFNRNRGGGLCGGVGVVGGGCVSGGGGGGKQMKFQYDAYSYALNFDDGAAAENGGSDEEYGYRNFSARYASVPHSTKKVAAAAPMGQPVFAS